MAETLFERKADFARRMKVSGAAVTQWGAADRLVLSADGLVDVEASKARLAGTMNTRGGKRKAGERGGRQAPEALAESGELELEGGTMTEENIARSRIKRKLDQLEYDEKVGRLIEKSRLDQALADGMATILSQLRTISVRTAPNLVGQTDLRRIQDAIDAEVEKICQETADTLRAMIAGSRITRQ